MGKIKEMLKIHLKGIWREFKINKTDLLATFVVYLVLSVITVACISALNVVALDNDYIFDIMFYILIGFACLITFCIGICIFSLQFPTGIGMSMTRTELIIQLGGLLIVMHGIMLVIAKVLYEVVYYIHAEYVRIALRNVSICPLWGWVLIVFAPIVFGMLIGAICVKFGKIGGWICYGCFIALCFLPSYAIKFEGISEISIVISDTVMCGLSIGVLLIVACISTILLKKVSIR